ncbi:MAG: glycosyltransferase [Burkholderiaceae bacterium]|nr:glycosyltransferase [Burkholderiaceae bacterium]
MFVEHVNFAKGFRGGERQTLNLMEGLAELGMDQSLVCQAGSELGRRGEAAGFKVRHARGPLFGHLVSSPVCRVIHVHEARGAYWAAIENMLRGAPYLITRRIPNPVSASYFNRLVYRRATELVGVSRDVSARLNERTGHHVHTILDSCTRHSADPEHTVAIRADLGGAPIIGHVGALHDHHKGQSTLIAAFQELAERYPRARLVLLGEGPDKGEFQRQARNDPRIVFAGFQEEVGSWIAAMDVFAFPSREEGLGSSVLDAMLLGVPVVTSNVGGLPELVGEQERGIMLDNHNPLQWTAALQTMLEDAALRDKLRCAALEFAQAHDIAAMTKDYLDLYRHIAGE